MATAKIFVHKLPGGGYVVVDKSYTPGATFYVDSTHASASDTPGFGKTTDEPLATVDYAVGRCTADTGDMILVMPGHVESLGAAASIDYDVAGITVIFLGTGGDRGRVDYDATDALVIIGANNIHVENMTLSPSADNVAIGIDIEAGVTGTVLETCETLHGEAAATDEFLIHVDIKAGCHGTKIQNCVFRSDDGTTPAVGVKLTGASHRCEIRNNTFMGPFSTAAVNGITTLSEDLVVDGNVMKVKDGEPGIELLTGTTGTLSRNMIESTGLTDPDAAIVADACGWIENYVTVGDAVGSQLVGKSSNTTRYLGQSARVGIGNVYYVNGGSDGPTDNNGTGLSPDDPKQTLTAALALCTTDNEDYIVVLNYGSNGIGAETWPIAVSKNRVHIIGVGTEGHKWPVVKSDEDTASISVTGHRVEIANLGIGGGATAGAVTVGAVTGSWGCTIHDCWFGLTGTEMSAQDGIRVDSGDDAPYLTVYGCVFSACGGSGLSRDGVRIDGNATRAQIGLAGYPANFFDRISGVGINLTGGAAQVRIEDNHISCDADTAGAGITLSASTSGCWVANNIANFGDADAMANAPYVDSSGADSNTWAVNYKGNAAIYV